VSCLAVTTASTPLAETLRRFERPFSADELRWLAGSIPGTAQRLHSGSGLERLTWANPLSLVYAYGVVHAVAEEVVDAAGASPNFPFDQPGFRLHCGDSFVSRRKAGGAFVISFRFEFASREALRAFQEAIGTDAPAWNLWRRIGARGAELAGWYLRNMEARKWGGDLDVLGPEGPQLLVECGPADGLAACVALVDAAVARYTATGPGSFFEELVAAPGELSQEVAPYATAGGPALDASVPPAMRLAREKLHGLLEEQRAIADRAAGAQAFLAPLDLDAVGRKAGVNVDLLVQGLSACYPVAEPGDLPAIDRCVGGALDGALLAGGYDPALSIDALTSP
jgi:hypothetical protein